MEKMEIMARGTTINKFAHKRTCFIYFTKRWLDYLTSLLSQPRMHKPATVFEAAACFA